MVRLLVGHGADIEKRDRVNNLSVLCLSPVMVWYSLCFHVNDLNVALIDP